MKLHIEIYDRLAGWKVVKNTLEDTLNDENLLVRINAQKELDKVNERIAELEWVLNYK